MRKKNALMRLSQALRGFIKPSKNDSHNAPAKKHHATLRKPRARCTNSKSTSEVRAETVRATEYVVSGNKLHYREVIRSYVHAHRRTVSKRG